MSADCLTRLRDFIEGMHDPLTEMTKVLVKRKSGSDAKPLHDREAGAIRKAESFVWILTEDGPSPFFVVWRDPDDRSRGLAEQAESKLQSRLISKSHSKEGNGFMNDYVTRDKKPIRGSHIVESLLVQSIGLICKSEKCRGINENGSAKRMGGQAQGFSCR